MCTYKLVRVTLEKCKAMSLMSGINNNVFMQFFGKKISNDQELIQSDPISLVCYNYVQTKKMLSIGQGRIWAFVALKGK